MKYHYPNPKTQLYKQSSVGFVISLAISIYFSYSTVKVLTSIINIQLAFAAILFFSYTLFVQSKVSDHRWNYVQEIIEDKFLLNGLYFFLITLIWNALYWLVDIQSTLSLTFIKFLYIFLNLFSLWIVFITYFFMIKLVSPLRLAIYLLSKVNVNRILKYELCTITTNGIIKVINRNIFSAPIRLEDPLQPLHEAMIIPIQNFDYRMLGNIIYNILSKSVKSSCFWEEPEERRVKFTYHLLDYCYSLQKNLINKNMYNWTNHKHLSHFIYIYLLVIKNNSNKSIEHSLLKASLTSLINLYYVQCKADFLSFDYEQHKVLLDEMPDIEKDEQIRAIRSLLDKNKSEFKKLFVKGTSIKNWVHPWDYQF